MSKLGSRFILPLLTSLPASCIRIEHTRAIDPVVVLQGNFLYCKHPFHVCR